MPRLELTAIDKRKRYKVTYVLMIGFEPTT